MLVIAFGVYLALAASLAAATVASAPQALVIFFNVLLIIMPAGLMASLFVYLHKYLSQPNRKQAYLTQLDQTSETKILSSALNKSLHDSYSLFNYTQRLEVSLLEKADFWQIYDATFVSYSNPQHKNQPKYQSRLRYSVCELQLRRAVPQLVFDSKNSGRHQFKTVYLDSQKLELDSNLDKVFDSYCHQQLQIEALSFITPEVIEALIATGGYDVEFVEDRLLCYRPSLADKYLPDLKQKALALHASVNDNLSANLKMTASDIKATTFKRRLVEDPYRYRKTAINSAIAVIVLVAIIVPLLLVIRQGEPAEAQTTTAIFASSLTLSIPLIPPCYLLTFSLGHIRAIKQRQTRAKTS